ncbi:MAG TPA: tetratricopeptide repeat protein, partial [Puia sp.]
MAKGAAFEAAALAYLEGLFNRLGYTVTEARRQTSGTQNGFDIRIGFLYEGRVRQLYFECKDYTSPLSWDDIAVKIFQVHSSSHHPDGYIAISPHVNLSNGIINDVEKLQFTIQAPIRRWSPETGIKEFFSLNAAVYEEVYGEMPGRPDSDATLEKLRGIFKDMLRQKDELIRQPPMVYFPKELTLKIPRIDPGAVIGRDEELEEVRRLLFGVNNQVVVVNGMGGIGKTTLAQAYISKYIGEYAHIAWITQLTGDIAVDIASAKGLPENLLIATEGMNSEQLFHELLRRMKAIPDGPNLLVLDNAEGKLSALKDYLPGKPQWHLLVTSRHRIEGFYIKELDFLSHDNAVALFKKHCSLIKEDSLIAELVEEVDYHTLTIEILAKTAQRRRENIRNLRNAIKEDLQTNVYIDHKGEKIDRVFSYLSSIFNFSGLDEAQQWVMKQFACLPSEFLPYKLLVELVTPSEERLAIFPETCNKLVEQGWLLYDADADTYKMHVIVQEVARRRLSPVVQDVQGLMDSMITNLGLDQSKDNPVDKFKWIPFGYTLLNTLNLDTSPEIAGLQNNLALMLCELGDYTEAKDLLEKSVAWSEGNFGADNSITTTRYTNLAVILRLLGDYAGAKALLEKAIAWS